MCKGNKIMDTDLIKAKKFISDNGYGSGTNYSTNLVAVLLADYLNDYIKTQREQDKNAH